MILRFRFILREQVEELEDTQIEPSALAPSARLTSISLKASSVTAKNSTRKTCRPKPGSATTAVHGGVMTATGYNDYLARITRRITEAVTLTDTTASSKAFANASKFPYIQINRAELAGRDRPLRIGSTCSSRISSRCMTRIGACCCSIR